MFSRNMISCNIILFYQMELMILNVFLQFMSPVVFAELLISVDQIRITLEQQGTVSCQVRTQCHYAASPCAMSVS
jgi:hypothetical protein